MSEVADPEPAEIIALRRPPVARLAADPPQGGPMREALQDELDAQSGVGPLHRGRVPAFR